MSFRAWLGGQARSGAGVRPWRRQHCGACDGERFCEGGAPRRPWRLWCWWAPEGSIRGERRSGSHRDVGGTRGAGARPPAQTSRCWIAGVPPRQSATPNRCARHRQVRFKHAGAASKPGHERGGGGSSALGTAGRMQRRTTGPGRIPEGDRAADQPTPPPPPPPDANALQNQPGSTTSGQIRPPACCPVPSLHLVVFFQAFAQAAAKHGDLVFGDSQAGRALAEGAGGLLALRGNRLQLGLRIADGGLERVDLGLEGADQIMLQPSLLFQPANGRRQPRILGPDRVQLVLELVALERELGDRRRRQIHHHMGSPRLRRDRPAGGNRRRSGRGRLGALGDAVQGRLQKHGRRGRPRRWNVVAWRAAQAGLDVARRARQEWHRRAGRGRGAHIRRRVLVRGDRRRPLQGPPFAGFPAGLRAHERDASRRDRSFALLGGRDGRLLL